MAAVNESAFSDLQMDLVQKITTDSGLTDREKQEAYAALVSDNYSDSINFTRTYSDGVKVDVSEMTVLEKTKLDGKFIPCDDNFEKGAEKGSTKEVCGGTLTYVGKEGSFLGCKITQSKGRVNLFGFKFEDSYMIYPWEEKGQIVHYEGELGSFDYNTREFELSYYKAEQNGNKIRVPVLHYIGDRVVEHMGTKCRAVDGSDIVIPEGLEIADYMFAGTDIESMPDIASCSTLESAHCMFKDCKNMTMACENALDENGNLVYPANLEDISWMFAGSGMTQFFGELGEKTMDARCAMQDCDSLGYVPSDDAADYGTFKFVMPNLTKARYLVDTYCDDMFDNSNTDVEKVVAAYVASNPDNPGHISEWTDEKGAHNNIYDKVNDGSYDADRIQKIMKEASKREVLKMIDPSGQGMTGVNSDTNGFMSSAVQLTDGGAIQDSSTWAMLRQTDKTFTSRKSNPFGELVDRGTVFLGTYGIVSVFTRNKWISLAAAAVPQFAGIACKITPVIDKAAEWLGPDNKVGSFLSSVSGKLKESKSSYHTEVADIDIEEVFAEQQEASVRFARNQVGSLLQRNSDMLYDASGYVIGAEYDASAVMRANGENLAHDGNLITIALTSDDVLSKSLGTALMETACQGIAANFKDDVSRQGVTDELKSEYATYFMTLAANLSAYSSGAVDEVNNKYVTGLDDKDKAFCGLEKVMRNTSCSLYDTMHDLDAEYGIFTEEQKKALDSYVIYGMPQFSQYDPASFSAPQDCDRYVDELNADKDTLQEAIAGAVDEASVQEAYRKYHESAYGYLMDEAKDHNVRIKDDASDTVFAAVDAASGAKKQYDRACEELGVSDSGEDASDDIVKE